MDRLTSRIFLLAFLLTPLGAQPGWCAATLPPAVASFERAIFRQANEPGLEPDLAAAIELASVVHNTPKLAARSGGNHFSGASQTASSGGFTYQYHLITSGLVDYGSTVVKSRTASNPASPRAP